jgi:hypothetical protein
VVFQVAIEIRQDQLVLDDSSPSRSTTGLATLILAIAVTPDEKLACEAGDDAARTRLGRDHTGAGLRRQRPSPGPIGARHWRFYSKHGKIIHQRTRSHRQE